MVVWHAELQTGLPVALVGGKPGGQSLLEGMWPRHPPAGDEVGWAGPSAGEAGNPPLLRPQAGEPLPWLEMAASARLCRQPPRPTLPSLPMHPPAAHAAARQFRGPAAPAAVLPARLLQRAPHLPGAA